MISLEAGKHFIYLFTYFFYIIYIYSLISFFKVHLFRNFVLSKLIFHCGNNIDAGQLVGVKMHSEILESIKIF